MMGERLGARVERRSASRPAPGMRKTGAIVLAALGASFLPLPHTGTALAFSAQGHRWPNQAGDPVPYRLEPNGSDDVTDGSDLEAIRRAFATWDSVACSYLEFTEASWIDPPRVANEGINRIFWSESEWTEQPATLALTYTFYRTSDRVVTDADIIVNGVHWRYTTVESEIGTGTPAKVDLETVLFHEIGHFFGLDHSQDQSAAMFPSNNKPMQRMPANDDIQGICSLYPNGQDVPEPMPGAGAGAVGVPCRAPSDCASSLCVQDELLSRTYCTAACNPQTQGSCPAGYDCAATQAGSYCLAPAIVDELCDQCDQGFQCTSGFCVTVPGVNSNRSFCSRPCDPTPGQPVQCPEGYSCTAVLGAAGGACAPNTGVCEPRGKGGQNEVCYANGACKPGFSCVEYYPSSGLNFCYYACSPQYVGLACTQGGGTRCDFVAGRSNAAVCFSVADAGAPCIPEICDPTSFCAYDENAGVDSALCYTMCPNGPGDCGPQAQCVGFPGVPNLCVPLDGFKYEGESCTSDNECRSHICRTYGQSRLCTALCAVTNPDDCGRGLKCVPQTGSTQGLCWPESFTDPGATDRTRTFTQVPPPPGFCACDTTSACNDGCPCDPECTGGSSCGCTTSRGLGDAPGGEPFASLAILVLGVWVARPRHGRRRRRSD